MVGAGPSGFYACEELLKSTEPVVAVDLLDRLPTPYGLVRYGVAPDHQKIKIVTAAFDKIAANPRFRYFGNVDVGKDVSVDEMLSIYDAVMFTVGAQTDKHLGIPGEDLQGSHPATEFVAWYNGHPEFKDLQFDLSCERAAVVGVGNVAVDVARILCSDPDELARTDIADYALEALRKSKIKEVVVLGRRGPAQAAFTNPELKELDELNQADLIVRPDEVELDEFSRKALEAEPDKAITKRLDMLKAAAARGATGKPRRLVLRFLVSPLELKGEGRVESLVIGKNRLNERLSAVATGETEELPLGLVFRSIGYRGVALPGLPFDEARGVIPNQAGRVMQGDQVMERVYTAGWIKRGPTGVIGTNKPCAKETAQSLLSDFRESRWAEVGPFSHEHAPGLFGAKSLKLVTYADWKRLDGLEKERGSQASRPRVKFTSVEEMLSHIYTKV